MTLQADPERIRTHIECLAKYNATPGYGITRMTFSEQDREARAYLLKEMKSLELSIKFDGAGNIRARMEGCDPKKAPVMTGSHIDTVFHGGKYDGAAGVVSALEAMRLIRDAEIIPDRPLELVIFAEEEGPNFGSPLAGSKAMIGLYTAERLKKLVNEKGKSMYEAAQDAGFYPDRLIEEVKRPGDISAMIEVHVEQSLVLDSEGISLGIVSGIAGMRWAKVTIRGESNHAGATPMRYRRDAMAGAAELVSAVESAAGEFSNTAVATAGKLICKPNVPNVIPHTVELYLDVRDVKREGMLRVLDRIKREAERICKKRNLELDIDIQGSTEPTECSDRIIDSLKKAATGQGIKYLEMTSGALHDTAVLASITDIGMLFVPSIKGRSHVPEEETAVEDIAKAAEVLTDTILQLSSC